METKNRPIPEFRSNNGWKEVPIEECGEPLVMLNDLDPDLIVVIPEYFQKKIENASEQQYFREGNAKKLLEAATFLQRIHPTYRLAIADAWRPLEVQQSLFDGFARNIKEEHPDWSDEKVKTEAQTYVSIPSADPAKPSPHNTGGAVDLYIIDGENEVPMGGPFDAFGEISRTNFYEDAVTEQEIEWRNNRRLLNHVMSQAGFINYPEEWWHFDYGNQFWAKLAGQKAIYGAVKVE